MVVEHTPFAEQSSIPLHVVLYESGSVWPLVTLPYKPGFSRFEYTGDQKPELSP